MAQAREWCIVINTPSPEEMHTAIHLPCDYSVVAPDWGKKTGRFHIHGYYQFDRGVRFTTMQRWFPRAHILKRKAPTQEACIAYHMKPNYMEQGVKHAQGHRTDMDRATAAIIAGTPMREVALDAPGLYVRYNRGLEALRNILMEPRTEPPEVTWLWGATGLGKTRYPHDKHGRENVYIKDSTQWWNNYLQQEAIVIDDFDVGKWPYRDLLRLLDRYEYQGQTKGGYVWINSPYIYITCSKPPEQIWFGDEFDQMRRRITTIIDMNPRLVQTVVRAPPTTTTQIDA